MSFLNDVDTFKRFRYVNWGFIEYGLWNICLVGNYSRKQSLLLIKTIKNI